MFDKPLGGTELMYNELMSRLPNAYKEQFSIFNYISQADFSKRTIFWNQLSHDQEAVQWLSDKNNIEHINNFVFVSNWQSENYRKIFGIPAYKSKVLKNAYARLSNVEKDTQKIKICYTSTPYRGLDVLLMAWEILNPRGCELHVFSSTKIYGTEFAATQEQIYEPLYQKCNELQNVVYRGSVPNDELLNELGSFHFMAYPSTFEETSCIAVIEAISNGLRVICSNLGALPETTQGWAHVYNYPENKEFHAIKLAEILHEEIEMLRRGYFQEASQNQKIIYSQLYNWDYRVFEWKQYLSKIILKEKNFITRNSWDRTIFQECFVENEYKITDFKETDVIIDLGCHIGSFSLLAHEKGSKNIYAFEALKANYEVAKENLKDTNVNLKNLAVWRSDIDVEKVKFNTNVVDWNTGTGRIEQNSESNEDIIDVDCIKFDEVLSQFEEVRILKIDIEGAEYSVLYTSCNLDKIQHICGEYHEMENNQINGYTFDGIGLKRFLIDNGFTVDMKEATWSNFCGFFNAIKIK
jgi:FkbM family methyltransferase